MILVTQRDHELHDHYARNATARGHQPECEKVTRPVNWPTLLGTVPCTCPHGGR